MPLVLKQEKKKVIQIRHAFISYLSNDRFCLPLCPSVLLLFCAAFLELRVP